MADIEVVNFFNMFSKIITGLSCMTTLPLYVIVLYVIWKHRKTWLFNSCYFNIYIVLGIVDIIKYFNYVIKKMPFWDIDLFIFRPYDANNWFCCVLYFVIWWFVVDIFKYEQINFFIFVECAALALPIFDFGSTIATSKIIFAETIITRHSGPVFMNSFVGNIYNWMWKGHIYFIIAICLVLYLIMFIKIRAMQSKYSNYSKIKPDIKIMYSAIELFFVNCIDVFYFIIRDSIVTSYPDFGKYTEWTLYTISDLYCLHNGIALILISTEIRKAVWKTLITKDDNHSHNITVVFA